MLLGIISLIVGVLGLGFSLAGAGKAFGWW